ncbi:type VI secretion protein IcmF/TssM N-terminal domain-containing protein, partial [Pseudomonas otitidis]
ERPLLRGVYFTSGTQEGSPIDRLIGAMAQSMNLDRQHVALGRAEGLQLAVQRLHPRIHFGDVGLVGAEAG